MRFPLNPHTKAILCGRGMCKCEVINGKKHCRLLCASENCIFHPPNSSDSDFGRDIEVKGYAICPRCKTRNEYPEDTYWDDRQQKNIMKCKTCGRIISKKLIEWTQYVISRHRRRAHLYYHAECYDKMFIDVPDDEDEEEIEILHCGCKNTLLVRLIKWAQKA